MKKKFHLFALIIISLNFSALTAQTISTISPSTANQGQNLAVTISGQNTHFAQGSATSVWLSQGSQTIYAMTPTPVSSTILIAQLSIPNNAALGQWNVNAFNPTDGNMVKYSAFTITSNPNPPQIISISPDSSATSQSLTVTITGHNTNFQQGTQTYAWISQGSSNVIPVTALNITSNTVLSGMISIPSSTQLGLYDANVFSTMDGNVSKPACFKIYAQPGQPSLVSLTPDSAIINQTVTYTLTGLNTHFTDTSLNIFFENYISLITNVSNIVVVNDTEVKFDANFSIVSLWDLHAQSVTDGNLFLGNAVTAYPVGIKEINDNPYNLKAYPNPFNDYLTIRGENFSKNSVEISILNTTGQIVYSLTDTPVNILFKKLSLSDLKSGIYLIRIETDDYSVTRKVVKY